MALMSVSKNGRTENPFSSGIGGNKRKEKTKLKPGKRKKSGINKHK